MQETQEAIDELEELGLPIGQVIVNRNIPAYLPPDDLAKAAEGDVDADAVRSGLATVGITLGRRRVRGPAHRDHSARDPNHRARARPPSSSTS